ncbi:MAG TPA: T9SS type A sorting domain-containing protein [Ignavibacteriaceae bacterium]|nr:T9SS type A sorting domain-containing protein [Ignavibacteriaceae bacterium]
MKKFFSIGFLFLLLAPFIYSQEGIDVWTTTTTTIGRIYGMDIYQLNQDVMFACGLDQGVNRSTDGGLTWSPVNNGLLNTQVQAIAIAKDHPIGQFIVYAGTAPGANDGVYKTTNGGDSWTRIVNGISEPAGTLGVQALLVHAFDPNIVWCTIFNGTADAVNGLYKTTDGGANWFPITNGIGTIKNFLSLAMSPTDPNTIYAGSSFQVATSTGPSAIYKSTDGGANWVLASNGFPTDPAEINPVRTIQVSTANPNVVIAGLFINTANGGFYLSTDEGANWTKKHNGLPTDVGTLIRSAAIRPLFSNQFYIGLDRATPTNIGVWMTTDGGENWSAFNGGTMLNTYGIRALVFNSTGNHTLFAGCGTATGQGVYEYTFSFVPVELVSFSAEVFSSEVTLSWITATELNNYGFQIERRNAESNEWTNIGFVNGNGSSTETQYYSFSDNSVSAGKYFYRLKQIDFNGSFEYSSEVEVTILEVFNDFTLNQNYPNPFNPSTRISFIIPQSGFTSLKVFDVLGNEVANIIEGELNAGSYELRFDASGLSSGIYFYSLISGEFTKTMKMILSK